jgi:hypothetical protein
VFVCKFTNRGTRHTSAKRYSFEHNRAVVFVVSQDVYVSIFSDGAKVFDSPLMMAREEERFLKGVSRPKQGDVSSREFITECSQCRKKLRVSEVVVIGWRDSEEAHCPVCSTVVHSARCFSINAILQKAMS